MMVGKRFYSEADMIRMQRDAEERVREMRNRVMQTSDTGGNGRGSSFMPSFANPNRNWDPNPSARDGRGRSGGGSRQNPQPPRRDEYEQQEEKNIPGAPPSGEHPYVGNTREWDREKENEDRGHTQAPPETPIPPKDAHSADGENEKGTTIIEDVIASLGIETDTLLIIGLILILVNQKADATLILALAYLLI